jgi:hypothetical protein
VTDIIPLGPEVERVWREFWLPIVGRSDGSIDMDQVKRELHDAHIFITEGPKVYMHVTGGRISKTNTSADAVIGQHDELWAYCKDDVVLDREVLEDWLAAIEGMTTGYEEDYDDPNLLNLQRVGADLGELLRRGGRSE